MGETCFGDSLMGTIGSIISIIAAVIQLIKTLGLIRTKTFLNDVHSGTEEMKKAVTPEAKSAAAKTMVDLISRL
jgi:hypothetical protein